MYSFFSPAHHVYAKVTSMLVNFHHDNEMMMKYIANLQLHLSNIKQCNLIFDGKTCAFHVIVKIKSSIIG